MVFAAFRELPANTAARFAPHPSAQSRTDAFMMFLIRLAFWLGLLVLLLPTDERQQARFYSTALATVERATTFCERNTQACAIGAQLWAMFLKKAEFGARMAVDLVSSGGRSDEGAASQPLARTEPTGSPTRVRPKAEPKLQGERGTLTPSDLSPAWRGAQIQRTGL
jgi:hypothetical protein